MSVAGPMCIIFFSVQLTNCALLGTLNNDFIICHQVSTKLRQPRYIYDSAGAALTKSHVGKLVNSGFRTFAFFVYACSQLHLPCLMP